MVKVAILVVVTLLGFGALLLYLARSAVLTPAQAGLMFIALLGMYLGFGTLIAVFRLINKLD